MCSEESIRRTFRSVSDIDNNNDAGDNYMNIESFLRYYHNVLMCEPMFVYYDMMTQGYGQYAIEFKNIYYINMKKDPQVYFAFGG